LVADFTAQPDLLNIEVDGTIAFQNQSQNSTQSLWTFGTFGTSTELNPRFAFGEQGVFVVTLTAINFNCTTSVTKTVRVINPNTSRQIASDKTALLQVYPNPTTSKLGVTLEEKPFNGFTSLTLIDNLGKVVFEKSFDKPGSHFYELDLSDFSSGVYSLRVNFDNAISFTKVVKQ
jgi:PKD repeat protein